MGLETYRIEAIIVLGYIYIYIYVCVCVCMYTGFHIATVLSCPFQDLTSWRRFAYSMSENIYV
jgi:hypothetical protein